MSGIRRRSRRQSDVPSKEPSSQCRRRATSPIIELPPDEAMEMIDRLVQGEETNFGVGAIGEKIPTLQDAAGPQGQLPVNISREGLKEYLDFSGSEDSSRVVSASVIEVQFLCRIGHKSLKDAWTTVARWFNYLNVQPKNEGWFIDDVVFFSSAGREDGKLLDMHVKLISFRLNHKNEDRANIAKFWEGWQAIVQLLCMKFLARMVRQNQEGPLLLGDEPQNAFGDTQAQWDPERYELVRERDPADRGSS
ncbi:hypothetical protein R1flu_005635 [Riccia fluitans]|uniref:Uncharacterized protein n=1 Tax=Riccia fluitans TaxID=41844 RepID=A0ABD1YTQ2_9MARC